MVFLYYRKRILQNYEEYNNYGKISEPVADSPLELMRETMKVNPFLLMVRLSLMMVLNLKDI